MTSLENLVSRVAALEAGSKPEEGWSKTDLRADVSEAISNHEESLRVLEEVRKAAGKATGFQQIYEKKDEQIRRLETVISEFRSAQNGATEIMEWWDANYRPLDELRRNEQAKIDVQKLTERAEAAVQEAGRKATEAKEEALREITRITRDSSGLIAQFEAITQRAESAANSAARDAAQGVKDSLANASQQVSAMERLKREAQTIVSTASETYLDFVRREVGSVEQIRRQIDEKVAEQSRDAESQREALAREIEAQKQGIETIKKQVDASKKLVDDSVANVEQRAIDAATRKLEEGNSLLESMREISRSVDQRSQQLGEKINRKIGDLVDGAGEEFRTLGKIQTAIQSTNEEIRSVSEKADTKLPKTDVVDTPTASKVAKYDQNGQLKSSEPTADNSVTTKSFVASEIAKSEAKLSQVIESKSIPPELTTTAYGEAAADKFLKVARDGLLKLNKDPVTGPDAVRKSWADATYIPATKIDGHNLRSGLIVVRGNAGNIAVPQRTTGNGDAISLKQTKELIAEAKQEAITGAEVTGEKVSRALQDYMSSSLLPSKRDKLVRTDAHGKIHVGYDATADDDVVRKKYLDTRLQTVSESVSSVSSKANSLEQKITNLEQRVNNLNIDAFMVRGNLTANDNKLHFEYEEE